MKVSLVVPLHNEAGNVERLVDSVLETLSGFRHDLEVLLVDDNSTDETGTLCDAMAADHSRVRVVHRERDSGFGNAIKAGLRAASGDVLIPFMGDLSDDPADVPALVAAIEDGYDVAYGSRFVEGSKIEGYPPLKLLYNRAYNNVIRLLFGVGARDVTNAFTAYRSEVVEAIGVDSLVSESFDLTVELPLRAHILGFRSTEVPVSWRSRDAGVSKLNATRKGPVYLKRLLELFVMGNAAGVRDIMGAIVTGSPLRIAGAAALGVLILVGLFSITGYEEVFTVLQRTRVSWLAVGAVAYSTSFVLRTWRYRVLLRSAGHMASRGNVFRSIMTGWFVNFLLPARAGDAARGVALKTTEGVPFGVATGLVVVERILDMLVLGGTMVVLATLFLRTARASYLALAALGIGALLAVGVGAFYVLESYVPDAVEQRIPGFREGVAALRGALKRFVTNPYAMALSLLLSLPVWALEASTIYFSARALGLELSAVATATTAIAAFVAQAVPVTPAGIGTYEATIAGVLSVFGVGTSTGTALGLVDHFMRVAVVYLVGAVSTVHLVFRSRPYFRDEAECREFGNESTEADGDTRVTDGE